MSTDFPYELRDPRDPPIPLDDLDVEQVDTGIVVSTAESRAILRGAGWKWKNYEGPLPECYRDEDGNELPSDMVPLLAEVRPLNIDFMAKWERKRRLLVDPDNPNSDYLTAEQLVLTTTGDRALSMEVPFWVKAQTSKCIRDHITAGKLDQLYNDHHGTGVTKHVPVRCQYIRTDGQRCWNWSANTVRGLPHCKMHSGWMPNATSVNRTVTNSKIQLAQSSINAVERLEHLMTEASSEPVQLKAATEILDRAGVRGGIEIDANVTIDQVDPAALVRERLERLAGRLAESGGDSTTPLPGVESAPLELEPAGGTAVPLVETPAVPGEVIS